MKKNHFVIQKHVRQGDVHWDFMLEHDNCLQTWRIDTAPDKLADDAVNAQKIFDHPLRFLTYEGPVNEGKGTVHIADSGTYQITETQKNDLILDMNGTDIRGKFSLKRIDGDRWQLQRTAL